MAGVGRALPPGLAVTSGHSPQAFRGGLMAAATEPLTEGAEALVLGTGFFGFLTSRFPRFCSAAMISLLDTMTDRTELSSPFGRRLIWEQPDCGRDRGLEGAEDGNEAVACPEFGMMPRDQTRCLPLGIAVVARCDDASREHATGRGEPMDLIGAARVS